MREIRIEKITLNVGAGKSTDKLEKGVKLLKMITGLNPVKTITNKRIAGWGLRPGLPIGCKVTIRGKAAEELLPRLLYALDKKVDSKRFDNAGNLSFGIPEYIEVQDAKYDPEIGVAGFEVCITLTRPGFRIKKRIMRCAKPGKSHLITKQEAIEYMKTKFDVVTEEE